MTMSLEGLPVLFEVFWKSGVALGAALCVNALLREKSADVRRMVLSTAIIAMFAAVLALPVLPRWTTVTPGWLQVFSPVTPPSSKLPAWPVQTGPGAKSVAPVIRAVPLGPELGTAPGALSLSWIPGTIPLIWFIGTALFLARFVVSLVGLNRLRHTSEAVTDSQLLACLDTASVAFGGVCTRSHSVALMQNDFISAPVTWGIVRPVILVPSGFERMPAESRNAVLCHELAHIQDWDFFLRGLAEIARSLIWFQPLMWMALRQLREEQELACDNRVLAAGGRASAYAKLLLEWDVRSGTGSLTAVGMAHRSCLKRRLYALLDQDLRRDRVAGTSVLGIWFLGLVAVLPLAAVSLTPGIDVQPTVLHPISQVEQTPVAKAERAPVVLPPAARQLRLAQVLPAAVPAQTPSTQPAGTNVTAVSTPLPHFVSTTSLVMVDATVEDTNGKAIEGLSAGSFVLTEDGKAQTISVFEFQKVDDATKNLSGYYVLGYYGTGDKADGRYHRIRIALAGDTTAKLDYRAGHYADKSFSGDSDNNIGAHFTVDDVANIAGGSKTMPPAVIFKRDPEYSEQARKAKYSGTVALLVDIGASGQVTSVTVIRSLGMGLDEKAIEAITQWRFRPGLKDGKPVSAQVQVNLIFRLL